MNKSLVSVIVLNYNAGKLLIDCIDSIKKSTHQFLEIIVVDNISSDNSQIECKNKFPDIINSYTRHVLLDEFNIIKFA